MLKKDRVDYKLVNLAFLALIVYLMYHTGHLWIGIFNKIVQISLPFLIAFAFAYAFYPIVQKLRNKGVPKGLSMLLVQLVLVKYQLYLIVSMLLLKNYPLIIGILILVVFKKRLATVLKRYLMV